MKKIIIACVWLMSVYTLSAAVNIIPEPVSVKETGDFFVLNQKSVILSSDATLSNEKELLFEILGRNLKEKPKANKNYVSLSIDKTLEQEEYRLTIDRFSLRISGGSPAGVFYALQSLRQIVVLDSKKGQKPEELSLPTVEIEDKPYFKYRGGMLDVCRYFFPVEDVKRFIDILAVHKCNRFHFHLTEDQGWRIEIKKYPELTKIGSIRKGTQIRKTSAIDNTPYGGFYTQDELRDIVAYAQKLHIVVIPEIEMPGHSVAALASYAWLGCRGENYEVRRTWGISKEVYCAGKETTFQFLEDVLREVMDIFPSEYIHIGGDECPKDEWKTCPLCQKRIKDEGLKDEFELQSYFVRRIEKFLNASGRKLIGWDEILEGGLSSNATVMSWRGRNGGIAAARQGNNVIMTPNTYMYLNYRQTLEPEKNGEPIAQGRHILPMKRVYSLDPFKGLNENERKFIIGVQANLWTEWISKFKHAQHMFLPRFAAVVETSWAYDRKNYDKFVKKLKNMDRVYDSCGFHYAPYFFHGIE